LAWGGGRRGGAEAAVGRRGARGEAGDSCGRRGARARGGGGTAADGGGAGHGAAGGERGSGGGRPGRGQRGARAGAAGRVRERGHCGPGRVDEEMSWVGRRGGYPLYLPSAANPALGKLWLCRVPDRRHSANYAYTECQIAALGKGFLKKLIHFFAECRTRWHSATIYFN